MVRLKADTTDTVRKPVVLITGANGEIGHALVANLAEKRNLAVVSLDLSALDPPLARLVQREFTGSILDANLLERVLAEFEVDLLFHFAALLSSRAEFAPVAAHHVNVEGTLNLLEFAARQGESHGRPVVFVYPSSIAAYGLPDLDTRRRAGHLREDDWNKSITMYGCNKLYCEQLGRYYARRKGKSAADSIRSGGSSPTAAGAFCSIAERRSARDRRSPMRSGSRVPELPVSDQHRLPRQRRRAIVHRRVGGSRPYVARTRRDFSRYM